MGGKEITVYAPPEVHEEASRLHKNVVRARKIENTIGYSFLGLMTILSVESLTKLAFGYNIGIAEYSESLAATVLGVSWPITWTKTDKAKRLKNQFLWSHQRDIKIVQGNSNQS